MVLDSVGLVVPGHPYAVGLTAAELAARSYYNSQRFGVDPSKLPPQVEALLSGNRAVLAVYGGDDMADPTLGTRLAVVDAPTLVVWGAADRIGDLEVGQAFAQLIPGLNSRSLPTRATSRRSRPRLASPSLSARLPTSVGGELAR